MELFDYEKQHLDDLRPYLAECCVLLKKDGSFPLSNPCKLVAVGPGVRDTLKGGTGSGEVNSRFYINVEEGLKNAGFELTATAWSDAYAEKRVEAHKDFVKLMKQRAKAEHVMAIIYAMGAVMPEPEYDLPLDYEGDAAIYVLSRICGEGGDRRTDKGDLTLTDTEIRDILALNKKFDKFMLVLNVGGPVDLTPVMEVKNILVLSQLGVETGTALADILLGKANPSGKLTTTWAGVNDYNPDAEFGKRSDTHYYEGIYVGYRYFDTIGKKPLFPFGYGLSYTEFEVESGSVAVHKSAVKVDAKVSNKGAYAGKEVVQLYVSKPAGKLDQPFQELCAYAKTVEIAPKASQEVELSFDLRDMASYCEKCASYVLEGGSYVLRLGTSSANAKPIAIIELDDLCVVKKVRALTEKPDFEDKIYACVDETLPQLPVYKVKASEIAPIAVEYDKKGAIYHEAKNLSDEDLCLLHIGMFDPKGGVASIIGNASQSVCGAAGETAKVPGFTNLTMADGPAGLRLTKKYYEDKKGMHAIGQAGMPESFTDYLSPFLKGVLKLMEGGKDSNKIPEGVEVHYQYATAIPIGTALAQSFNHDLVEKCGDIVGEEMNRFGVHLWLAPALNIHRSVLCGRNFEYYSEDPLLSGKMAAAMTRGVQKHQGAGVTIKHYCCNNQELNRVNSNSCVSERALREIYLKGFGIAIAEAQPIALMTSYNLLNATHTNEQRALLQDYLRAECGYTGLIMTDWTIAAASSEKHPKYEQTNAARSASAGNQLFMPGCNGDYKCLLKALKKGQVSREQLEINASNVLDNIKKLVK